MKVLKELSYVLSKNKLPLVNAAGFLVESNSKIRLLFDGISKSRYASDEAAAVDLYGDAKSGSYRKLKSDLLDCLINSVARLDTQQDVFTEHQKSYYECHRQWYVVRILTGQNANTAALSIAVKLLKQADKHEFTLLCMDVTSYLRIQYCIREVNGKKYEEANKSFEYYRALYDAEMQAEQVFTLLSAHSANNRLNYQALREEAKKGYAQLAPLLEKHNSYKIQLYGRLVNLILHTSSYDYLATLACCKEALHFFEDKSFRANVPMQVFLHEQLVCQIQLRLFEDGFITAQRSAMLLSEGTYNWFKHREVYFLLLMHTSQWERARFLFLETVMHSRFSFLPESAQETWRIYEAYIHYMAKLGCISPISGGKKFRIQKFVNDTHLFSKDKDGANISIVVIHYLFLVLEQKHALVLDRVATLEHYCRRYLLGEHNKRSFYFFKLLLQIPRGRFDVARVNSMAQKLLEALCALPIEASIQGFEIEILPYEALWALATSSLQKRVTTGVPDASGGIHFQKLQIGNRL